jgi:hypothetical protein
MPSGMEKTHSMAVSIRRKQFPPDGGRTGTYVYVEPRGLPVESAVKQWLVPFAAFAILATAPMPASAQQIIEIPRVGEPKNEASPPPRERVYEDQEPRAASGCWVSSVEDETPAGKRTVTRYLCH